MNQKCRHHFEVGFYSATSDDLVALEIYWLSPNTIILNNVIVLTYDCQHNNGKQEF